MGVCTIRRAGAVVAAVWLVIMVYLWFPNILPLRYLKMAGEQNTVSNVPESNNSLDNAVHVCITSDKNTLGGMIALINSIYSNTKHNVVFHLVVDKESADHVRQWIDNTALKYIRYELRIFPEEFVKGKINVRGDRKELASPLNYARFYLPELFPHLHGKIIYIDDDSIVQGDIKELYDTKFKPGHMIAFSQDCVGPAKRITHMQNNYADYIDFKNNHVKEMKMDPSECAINSGVFVADLQQWRKKNITKELEFWMTLNTKEEVYGNERAVGGSQPPMMIVFYKNYTEIDPNWHVRFLGWTAGTSYSKNFLRQAHLLHWNGRFKPWGRVSAYAFLWERYFIKDPLNKFTLVRKT